ncbi:hypothetical protein OAB59_03915, partial [Pelagibacteraceae bacterium]|nr:hypothetical protein [Pelagibacteraceae bacterium]
MSIFLALILSIMVVGSVNKNVELGEVGKKPIQVNVNKTPIIDSTKTILAKKNSFEKKVKTEPVEKEVKLEVIKDTIKEQVKLEQVKKEVRSEIIKEDVKSELIKPEPVKTEPIKETVKLEVDREKTKTDELTKEINWFKILIYIFGLILLTITGIFFYKKQRINSLSTKPDGL